VARLYQVSEDEGGCPGESNCETWQSSAADAAIRCPSCPKRRSEPLQAEEGAAEPGDQAPETWDETQLLDGVERFRQERNSGRAIYELTSPIEWEAILIWDETIAQYHRGHELRIEQMFHLMTAAMTRT
jgi:hypothetical protein